jgi:Domain of unknown function (DUF4126)
MPERCVIIVCTMETLFAVGTGIGLSSIAGVRAYLPLVLVGLFARVGLFTLPAPFDLLESWLIIGVLLVLALLESGLDKIPALDHVLNFVQIPMRVVAGAMLFSAALEAGLGVEAIPELVVGGVLAGLVAVSKVILRPSATAASVGVSIAFLSTLEDVVALLGGLTAVLLPLVPLAFVAFLLFFFFRVKRRRRRKYGGLRILGD